MKKIKTIRHYILREKPVDVIVELLNGKSYALQIAKKYDINYVHIQNLLNNNFGGLIESSKDGRIHYRKLTHKGVEVAKHFKELNNIFEGLK